jgi:hypothetical protein
VHKYNKYKYKYSLSTLDLSIYGETTGGIVSSETFYLAKTSVGPHRTTFEPSNHLRTTTIIF